MSAETKRTILFRRGSVDIENNEATVNRRVFKSNPTIIHNDDDNNTTVTHQCFRHVTTVTVSPEKEKTVTIHRERKSFWRTQAQEQTITIPIRENPTPDTLVVIGAVAATTRRRNMRTALKRAGLVPEGRHKDKKSWKNLLPKPRKSSNQRGRHK